MFELLNLVEFLGLLDVDDIIVVRLFNWFTRIKMVENVVVVSNKLIIISILAG